VGFQHLHCKNIMNKKEIELHYLPCSICGTNVLGVHHSTKSTEASSSHSDTKVVAVMCRGGSQHSTGWAAPPVVASSAGSQCSSCDDALGWCRPVGGVGARSNHGVVRVQSVAHSEWRGRPESFVYAFASCQGTKMSLKTLALLPRWNVVSPAVQGTIRL
jgi:hypothetical protein